MTKGTSILKRLDDVLPRMSDATAERFTERFFFAFGFVLQWVCCVGVVVYCYLQVSKVIDVSFAHLTLRMLLDALSEVAIGVYVFHWAFTQRERHYAAWGGAGFYVILLSFFVWSIWHKISR